MASFLAELKRRNVFKVATIYVVVSWLLLQVVSVVFPVFDIPMWASRLVVILLGLGFPVALLMAWAFDLTPTGIEWDSEKGEHHVHTHVWDWILGILLVVVIGLIVTSEINDWRESSASLSEPASTLPDAPNVSANVATSPSIAVLPFVNMSGDADNEYFSDGMSEEILNLLAKIPALKVIGRTSSFAFKGLNEDLRVIGQALGVTTILEGSVRKSGERVRITAQLVDALDGAHMWSDTYDRTLTDIFAVQDDVASAIIDALQMHIGAIPSRGRPTELTGAYTLFLKARALKNTFNWHDAETTLLQAIELDQNYAEAYELLASVYWGQAGAILEAPEAQKLMGEAAAKALSIDPNLVLARALYQSGNLETYSVRIEIEALERAARAQPDDSWTLGALVLNLIKAGYLQEALTVAERLAELDPLSPLANGRLQVSLVAVGRTGDAFAALERLGKLDFEQDSWYIGEVNLAHKRDNVAIAHFEAGLEQGGITETSWVRELVTGAGDPATGQSFLDRRIPQVVASMPEEYRYLMERRLADWYLYFGFLDRYFEIIFDLDLVDSAWSDADDLITTGTINRPLGFTAHPKFLELAALLGYVDVWEHRGPPDFCEKLNGDWVCE